MTIQELNNKIIDLEDFFRQLSVRLEKISDLRKFCFLLPGRKKGSFEVKYFTGPLPIRLTEKNLFRFYKISRDGILLKKVDAFGSGFISRIFLNIYWKITQPGAYTIMPIYRHGKIICLILFFDKQADSWLNRHRRYIAKWQGEIAYSLEVITLYNQALKRIARILNVRLESRRFIKPGRARQIIVKGVGWIFIVWRRLSQSLGRD